MTLGIHPSRSFFSNPTRLMDSNVGSLPPLSVLLYRIYKGLGLSFPGGLTAQGASVMKIFTLGLTRSILHKFTRIHHSLIFGRCPVDFRDQLLQT